MRLDRSRVVHHGHGIRLHLEWLVALWEGARVAVYAAGRRHRVPESIGQWRGGCVWKAFISGRIVARVVCYISGRLMGGLARLDFAPLFRFRSAAAEV